MIGWVDGVFFGELVEDMLAIIHSLVADCMDLENTKSKSNR